MLVRPKASVKLEESWKAPRVNSLKQIQDLELADVARMLKLNNTYAYETSYLNAQGMSALPMARSIAGVLTMAPWRS